MAKAAKPATASRSPSSRRAWIEMLTWDSAAYVARSPSSRRAWIEIVCGKMVCAGVSVALLAEGVDRNQMKRSANP